jgi:hypothetical protein
MSQTTQIAPPLKTSTEPPKDLSIGRLLVVQPYNIVMIMCFFSPIILALCIIGTSFISQNFKGFIFMGFLIGVSLIRNYIYSLYKDKADPNAVKPSGVGPTNLCNVVQYSKFGNESFSTFVFAFTIVYLTIPMFLNGMVNFWILGGLLFYLFLDVFIKKTEGCNIKSGDMVINALLGVATACLIVSFMYSGGSSKFLFFSEITSTGSTCSVAKNQTFKCSVYKNGELIA